MWDRINLRKAIDKSYGKLTRLGLTMYECVGRIAQNHIDKIAITNQIKEDLIQQQKEILRISQNLSDIESSLNEESELASALYLLSNQISILTEQNETSLKEVHLLIQKEEENSSDIWKTLHAEKALLHESILILGKAIQKNDLHDLTEQEKIVNEHMRKISNMFTKKEEHE